MSFWELLLNSRVTGNLVWIAPIILIILLFKKPIQERILGITEIRWKDLSVKMRERVDQIAKRPAKEGLIPSPDVLIGLGELATLITHDIFDGDLRALMVDFTAALRITQTLDLHEDSLNFKTLLEELRQVREFTPEMKERLLTSVDTILVSIQNNLMQKYKLSK